MRLVAIAAAVVAVVLSGTYASAGEVRVFAAASLKNALDEVAEAWKKGNDGRTVTATYAASSALAKQIAEGAPADIFISADVKWMDDVEAKGLTDPASRFNLAGNTLVLVAPAGATLTVDLSKPESVATALDGGKLAVADVKAVPAGRYARQALESLGVYAALEPSLAQTENVRVALALVARGEAALGIVYGSDAVAEPQVKVVAEFPERTHDPIVYPAALVKGGTPEEPADFLAMLKTPVAKEILARHGFLPPPG